MGKKIKNKKVPSLVKKLSLIIGLFIAVIVVAVVVVKAINKTTIKTITVEGAYSELYIGNPEFCSTEVGISVYPETASKSSLMAYSENPEIATVNFDGEKLTVEAVGVGTTTIVVRHANKSSLYDTIQITVKDKDIQTLTFVESDDENGALVPVDTVSIKKDGFKHSIPFVLEPIDANMNNLKINDFNTAVFESVEIDPVTKSVIVVPKTDIIQTSAEIDIEIYQNTTEGYSPVQVVTLMVDLLNREAYIRFNLSSIHDSDRKYVTVDNKKSGNIVYIEPSNATGYNNLVDKDANYVYVLPEIGYDANFSSVGGFNIDDYDLYFDGNKVNDNNFNSSGCFTYENKLVVNKSFGNCYKFNSLNNFTERDSIFVEFVHKYTGASSGLQFMSLARGSIGLSVDQGFEINNLSDTETNHLNIGDVLTLDFSYDECVNLGMVEIYSYVEKGGEFVPTTDFGNAIRVNKDNKKISLWAYGITDNTVIQFGITCNYWDTRYVNISEGTSRSVAFSVSRKIEGIHVEVDGKEVNTLTLTDNSAKEIEIVAEPQGGVIDQSRVEITSNGIKVEYDNASQKIKISKNSATIGTYTVTFKYNNIETKFYVMVK